MPEILLPAVLPAVLTVPLVWVVLSLLWPARAPLGLTGLGVLLQLAASLLLAWRLTSHGPFQYALGGWEAPLGIMLRADGPAVVFVVLTTLVAGACALHAHLYLNRQQDLQRFFWPLLWFLWAGLNGIWLSGDLFNLYVGLELVSLSAVGMVAISGQPHALAAALRYLLAALMGSLAYLLGVALIYGSYGALSLSLLATQVTPEAGLAVAAGLMVAGLAFKTALFPLHGWLPPAHGGALTPVSALLSALVIKASFYVLVRLWLELGHAFVTPHLARFLGLLGILAIAWGSWQALHQSALKMVVAYSTVAQVGYFFLLFPLLLNATDTRLDMARDGILLLLVSHALAKAAMFLAAGNLIISLGQDVVDDLRGISRFTPISLFSFALAGVTLMGMPPSGGFTAKWMLLQSALAGEQWLLILVIVLGGLATASYIFRIFHLSLREGPQKDTFHHPAGWLEVAPMALALMSVLLGVLAAGPLGLIALGAAPGGEAS